MSEDSQIILTTKDDLDRLQNLIVGNSVRSMRLVSARLKRRMVIYENRLTELYRNEKIIKARIYNNVDALKIDSDYTAGKGTKDKSNPSQTFTSVNIVDTPHQNIGYDKSNILTMEEGVRKLDAELNRINTEIKHLQSTLREYEQKYEQITLDLKKAAEEKDKKSKLGRFFAPTEEDLLADQIAQAKTYNVLALEGIIKQFMNYSSVYQFHSSGEGKTVAEWLEILEAGKVTGYPDGDDRLVNQLRVYQQLFWAHGHAKGLTVQTESGEVVPLSTLLNFDNPADTKNVEVIEATLAGLRGAARSTKKMTLAVDRYIADVDSVVADPLVSHGVEIRPDTSISVTESQRLKTLSYPTSALRIGDFYLGSFEMPTLTDSIRKNWKKRNARLYSALPVCPNAKPSGTSTDTKEEEAEVVQDALLAEAQALYIKKLEEAEKVVYKEIEENLGDLPEDADEWVKIYVGRFQSAARGIITYEGNKRTVLRGTSKESVALAFQRANKTTTFPPEENMEEKDAYSYPSILGYNVEIFNQTVFVSLGNMEIMLENKIPDKYKKQQVIAIKEAFRSGKTEPVYEYIAYVMWGKKES